MFGSNNHDKSPLAGPANKDRSVAAVGTVEETLDLLYESEFCQSSHLVSSYSFPSNVPIESSLVLVVTNHPYWNLSML